MAKFLISVTIAITFAASKNLPPGHPRGEHSFHRCPYYSLGTTAAADHKPSSVEETYITKEEYKQRLETLDIKALYDAIISLMTDSQKCWPADYGSYAGLFARLAWHCSGTFREVNGTAIAGGCEGARQRSWPEAEWRDNINLDKARGLLGQIKHQFGKSVSWSDIMTFAGTASIHASGGPVNKFCFGRRDDTSGDRSIPLGVEGVITCDRHTHKCTTDKCSTFKHPEQAANDTHFQCFLHQANDRLQASHSVGLIYVYPEGPSLSTTSPDYKPISPTWVHNRSPRLSGLEVRDTFKNRMGWTDRQTVALSAGGHTLGKTHGACNTPTTVGPFYESPPHSGGGTCRTGRGIDTISSGFDGPWTTTPTRWNYEYLHALLTEEWIPAKSPFGNDQWIPKDPNSPYKGTMRLTADMGFKFDPIYRAIAEELNANHTLFDSEFAEAWRMLVHRSLDHPGVDDLEKDFHKCTDFNFMIHHSV